MSMGSECLGTFAGSYRAACLTDITSDFSLSWAGFFEMSSFVVGTCFLATFVTGFFLTATFFGFELLLFCVSLDLLLVPFIWL